MQESLTRGSLVSVVIPCYNGAIYIDDCIRSVLEQTYSNIEVIFIDCGSTDDSLKRIRGYPGNIKILCKNKCSLASARNFGIEAAKGDYIAFLDVDDVWLPNKIEEQLNYFNTNIKFGLVHCGCNIVDSNLNKKEIINEGKEGDVFELLISLSKGVIKGGGSSVVLKKEVVEKIGLFDEKLSYSADWDYWVRVAKYYEFGFCPKVLWSYRCHRNSLTDHIELMESEILYIFKKLFSSRDASYAIISKKHEYYANLYRMLAGSFFYKRKPHKTIYYIIKSLISNALG